MTASFGVQLGRMARRSILRTVRQPLVWGPMLIFPLFFFAITAPGLEGATAIKGFPTDSYVSFALAMPFVQAGLSGVQTAGGELAEDIRTGFLSRLSLTPLQRRGARPGRPGRRRSCSPSSAVCSTSPWDSPRARRSRRGWVERRCSSSCRC